MERMCCLMTTGEIVIAIIVAIVGSGGVSAIITSLLSAKKFSSESRKMDVEADCLNNEEKRADMEYLSKRLREISEAHSEDSMKLRQRNDELSRQINDLNNKLQKLMEWIIYDNSRYVSWLEARLKEHDPNVVFPECPPPPKIFTDGAEES